MDRDEMKRRACEAIDKRKADIIQMAQTIFQNPELGFKETKTAALVKDVFGQLKLPIREGLAITGVEGTLQSKQDRPSVVIMGELDSVVGREAPRHDPVTGASHLCGHHIQVGTMLGTAIGLVESRISEYLTGKVKFLGVPAEEYIEIEYRLNLRKEGRLTYLGGKQELIKQGYFDDTDIAMMVHAFPNAPEARFYLSGTGNGFLAKFVHFKGRPAHAGAVPHEGVNALNAACLAILGIHAQRETFQDKDSIRVHPIITKGGDIVNVVPSDVQLETYVRGRTLAAILDASRKVDRALRAGGDAVGAETSIVNMPGYLPMFQDDRLNQIARSNARVLLGEKGIQDAGFMAASFDIGDVAHLIPILHPFVGGTRGSLHTSEFSVIDYEASAILPAKLLAMCVVDLLAEGAAEAKQVIKQFKPLLTKEKYLELMEGLMREP
jgi:amidohydrolase